MLHRNVSYNGGTRARDGLCCDARREEAEEEVPEPAVASCDVSSAATAGSGETYLVALPSAMPFARTRSGKLSPRYTHGAAEVVSVSELAWQGSLHTRPPEHVEREYVQHSKRDKRVSACTVARGKGGTRLQLRGRRDRVVSDDTGLDVVLSGAPR